MVTVLFCSGSSAKPRAFSMPASPPPITKICSSKYSRGSSSWYWTWGSLAPSQRTRLGFPWVPMAMMIVSAFTTSPLVRVMVKSPLTPVTDLTSAL